jgi:hypothetical protein
MTYLFSIALARSSGRGLLRAHSASNRHLLGLHHLELAGLGIIDAEEVVQRRLAAPRTLRLGRVVETAMRRRVQQKLLLAGRLGLLRF